MQNSAVVASAIFPWHRETWQRLWCRYVERCLPHALLFAGIAGVGKTAFAEKFAQALLCKNPGTEGLPCEVCSSCCLLLAHSHPDVFSVCSEPGHAIKVDQIREMIDFVNKTALQGGYRVVLMHAVTNMNMYAANALLKTLEEPSPNVVIILISNQNNELPATLRSRCLPILFPVPAQDVALSWLQQQVQPRPIEELRLLLGIAYGAPLRAIEFFSKEIFTLRADLFRALGDIVQQQGDPLKYAAQWQALEVLPILDLLMSFLSDLFKLHMQCGQEAVMNRDFMQLLLALGSCLPMHKVQVYVDYLQQVRRYVTGSSSLNKQLLLEDVFIRLANTSQSGCVGYP
ncbi:MAG: DNA polymerase III subunit delta' [Gammaproteobacteria bacterium RIFCSPHIGHO2_12_FULL_41_20]|nr:MAG: DNA polymerase III subunit delta' [Gammaproteobacteria bacterium RIFCSPHIGHO2_12_FULL_41_20]